MRDLSIAYGSSRQAKVWTNKTILYGDLKDRLRTTIRTPESAEEYAKFDKAQKDMAKDHGGFVAGSLEGGRRKAGSVTKRSMIALDGDKIDRDFLDRFEELSPYTAVLYSTHSSTLEKPRARIIYPLTRDVTPEEFVAVSRYVAKELGIDYFDECSYQPNQLMYWPSTPLNGEFIFKEVEKEWLDPDKILAAHPEWRDPTQLPTSSKESRANSVNVVKVKDPLSKEGIVGAFNRTYYPISLVIDKYLSDIYEPTDSDDRYHYIESSSLPGVEIIDNGKFVYSHHAKDPAYLKLCNAFDIVRVHLFGDSDSQKSYSEMADLAANDDAVKITLAQERVKEAGEEFRQDNWQARLEINKKGEVEPSINNLVLILRNDENLGNIAFNRQRDGIDARGGLPWKQLKPGWSDTDNAELKVYLANLYKIYAPNKTKDALQAVASERSYHPIKEYLEALPPWDNIPRLDTLFIDYLGAEDNDYTRAVARKSMVAAVARVYKPGTKFDSVPILNGPQGVGKSTLYAKLAGEWFSDSLTLTDMKDKAGPEKLQGYWILELGELAGMRKTDVETVKSFISRVDDKYRASYGVSVESHPRQCIIVGSTNAESGFLRDITGNRRFWPIRVTGDSEKKPWGITKEDIDQIWAETLVRFKQGEKLYLEGSIAETAVSEQASAMESDEREGLIREYLDTLLPENWDEMGLYDRRNFLSGDEFGISPNRGTVRRTTVCNLEIWSECFGKDPSSIKTADSYSIAAAMKKIEGWSKDGSRAELKIYGRQRVYVRTDQDSCP